MKKSIAVTAYAKINLTLDVTGRRGDGYHTLNTIMQSMSLSDTVTLVPNSSGKITVECNMPNIPCNEKNIAYKAAELFLKETGICCDGLHISLEKHIPSEAGLGGGSADGAAVLGGLNQLYDTKLTPKTLCNIGVKIGADVPFCIIGGTKLCKGIGEIISDAPELQECFIVIGKGIAGISTKEAYGKIDKLGLYNTAASAVYDGTLGSLANSGMNIFERVAECGDVENIKKLCLDAGAVYSAMSGSGSAVFGLFEDMESARLCCCTLQKSGCFAEICTPVSCGIYFN